MDTVWPAEPKIFTFWPWVDFCPRIYKAAFFFFFYSSLDSVKHGMAFPSSGLAGRDITSWFLASELICHHSHDGKSLGPISNTVCKGRCWQPTPTDGHSPHTTRSAEASSTPRELVARQV